VEVFVVIKAWGWFVVGVTIIVFGWVCSMQYIKKIRNKVGFVASKGVLVVEDTFIVGHYEIFLIVSFEEGEEHFFVGNDHPDFGLVSTFLPGTFIRLEPLKVPLEGLEEFRPSSYVRFIKVQISESISAHAHA
jgi:hypothetical protein